MPGASVRIGGQWGHLLGSHDRPTWETVAQGGCGDATIAFNLPRRAAPVGLHKDALVEIYENGAPVYTGRVNAFERDTGIVRCAGLFEDAYSLPALDSSDGMTLNVAIAINQARAKGWWPVESGAAWNEAVAGDTSEPMTIGKLIELYAEQKGFLVYGVDADRQIMLREAAATPKWIVTPGSGSLGSAAASEYNCYAGRYRNPSGVLATAYSPLPTTGQPRIALVDLTNRGRVSQAQAVAILTKIADATRDRPGWTTPLTLSSSQIRTVGRRPATLSEVKGGDLVRFEGLTPSQQAEADAEHLDVVLGSVTYTSGADEIEIQPQGVSPVSLEDVVASI